MARKTSICSEADKRDLLAIGDHYNDPLLALEVIREGGTVRDFVSRFADKEQLPTTEKLLGITQRDVNSYSISKLIRAQAEGRPLEASHEKDLSALLTAKTGHIGNGELVPFSVLARDFNVGTASEAGNLIGAARTGNNIGDPIRKVFSLAALGAEFITNLSADTTLPVFGSTSTAAHLTEIGGASTILETTRAVVLQPRRLSVTFVMSRQAAIQAAPELDAAVVRQMRAAIDEEMLRGILVGDGTGQNPTGILHDSGVSLVEAGGANGGALTDELLYDMEYAPAAANISNGSGAWMVNAGTLRKLRLLASTTTIAGFMTTGGNALAETPSQLLGRPIIVTNHMPANLTKGTGTALSGMIFSPAWQNLVVGIFGAGIDVITDRVTLAAEGKLRVVCSLYYAHGLREPSAFAVCRDLA